MKLSHIQLLSLQELCGNYGKGTSLSSHKINQNADYIPLFSDGKNV